MDKILHLGPVIAVVTLKDERQALPLAQALLDGGIRVIEVTMRTAAALPAIRSIAAELPDAVVGAGTVLAARQIDEAMNAGARFLVSPGATETLIAAARASSAPLLPGSATVSEAMRLLEAGYTCQKFFPAASAGGVAALAAIGAPLPQIQFCPTGGILAETAAAYLRLPNVPCIGGSWLTPADAIAAGDWERIRRLARAATELRRAMP